MRENAKSFMKAAIHFANLKDIPTITNINQLYGNLSETTILNGNDRSEIHVRSLHDFMETMRRYKLLSKNYSTMYISKLKVTERIIVHLLTEYLKKIEEISNFFIRSRKKVKSQLEGKPLEHEMAAALSAQKKQINTITDEFDVRKTELADMLKNVTERDCVQKMTDLYLGYIGSITKLTRKLEKKSKQVSSHESDPNPMLLEFNMLLNFRRIFHFLEDAVIPKLFDVHLQVEKKRDQGLRSLKDFGAVTKCEIDLNAPKFSLSSLLSKNLRRFIKNKIGLEHRMILTDDHLKEFFELYEVKYPQDSYLFRAVLPCTFELKKKVHPMHLILDVG